VLKSIGIYTQFSIIKTMAYKKAKLPLLLERVGVRRIKSSIYISPSSQPSPSGEGVIALV